MIHSSSRRRSGLPDVKIFQQFSGPGLDVYRARLDAWLAANGLLDSRWYVAEPAPRVIGDKIVIWRTDAEAGAGGSPVRVSLANIREERTLLVPLPAELRADS